jgi:hypothetical protein
MARPLRLEPAGALYHVTARGDGREDIYLADGDRRLFRDVAEGKGQPSPWEQLKHQVYLGTDAFVESMRRKVPEGLDLREIPQSKARAIAKPLSYYARQSDNRNRAIAAAYASGGYTMRNIGDFSAYIIRV